MYVRYVDMSVPNKYEFYDDEDFWEFVHYSVPGIERVQTNISEGLVK